MTTVGSAFARTIRLLVSQRRLWVPFVVTAIVEALLLLLVWLAPHPPFAKVLAPPIVYFAGERVLHYPWHLWFLYHAMKHTNVVAATLVGAFLSGLVCVMVQQAREGKVSSVAEARRSGQVKYVTVTILWLLTWGSAKIAIEALGRIAPPTAAALWGGIGLLVAIQTLFVYAIPAAVYERRPWWSALGRALKETLRYPVSTFIVTALLNVLVVAFGLVCSETRAAIWMQQTEPEIAVALVFARLVVWTVTDALLTVSIANLWWIHRSREQVVQPVVGTSGASVAAAAS